MKIYYASDAELSKRKANAIHVMKMCAAFAQQKNEVILIVPENQEGKAVYDYYGVRKTFDICEIQMRNCKSKVISNLNRILNGKERAKYINKNYTDGLVYARSIITLFFLSKNIPFIYELHSVPANRVIRMMERFVISRKNMVGLVTISQALKERYLSDYKYLEEKQIIVLHDGADEVDSSIPKAQLYQDNRFNVQPVVGYIGSLYPGKCMEVLLPVAREIPDVLFHVVGGDEDLVRTWEKKLKQNNVENIHLYGKVTPNEVGSYYAAFDICVMPFSDNIFVEAKAKHDIGNWISPLKLFEAMAYGKAIISSDLPSIAEVMDNNKDCILVNPSDISKWASTIVQLQNDLELRDELGRNARIKLEKEYSWNKRAQKVISFYLARKN